MGARLKIIQKVDTLRRIEFTDSGFNGEFLEGQCHLGVGRNIQHEEAEKQAEDSRSQKGYLPLGSKNSNISPLIMLHIVVLSLMIEKCLQSYMF